MLCYGNALFIDYGFTTSMAAHVRVRWKEADILVKKLHVNPHIFFSLVIPAKVIDLTPFRFRMFTKFMPCL